MYRLFFLLKTIVRKVHSRFISFKERMTPFFFFSLGVKLNADGENLLIVSLTSFPQRIYMKANPVVKTIYSLLRQTVKPDKIILWLAEEEFPGGQQSLPLSLRTLKKNGLEICFCKNFKSYKKLLPVLNQYPQANIVTADDDIWYPEDWLDQLLLYHKQNPHDIIAHRGSQVKIGDDGKIAPYLKWKSDFVKEKSLLNFPTTGGGVLYPPHVLYSDFSNYEIIKKIAPYQDDLFFWAMAVLQHTQIFIIPHGYQDVIDLIPEKKNSVHLYIQNCLHGENDLAIQRIFARYPRLMQYLQEKESI